MESPSWYVSDRVHYPPDSERFTGRFDEALTMAGRVDPYRQLRFILEIEGMVKAGIDSGVSAPA